MEIVMTKRFVAFLLTALLTCLPLLTGLSDYSSEFYAKVQSIALDDMMQGEGNQDYLLSIDEPADIIVHSTGCEVYIGGNSEERQYLESGIYKIHVLSEGEYSLQIVKADAYNARSEEIGNSDDEYIRMVSVPVNHGSGTLSLSFDETAGIPETAEFLAEALDPLSEEYEQYAEAACAGFTGKSGILGLYDLKILQDGNIIEPEAPVTVTMDIDGEIPSDATIYAIHFPGSTQDNLAVNKPLKAPNAKNITQASGGVVLSQLDLETIPVVHNGPRSISFVAASFSVFAIVYTVDFHYEVNGKTVEFSIPGGGFTTLADVVEMLGIAEFDENTNPSVEDVDATQAVKEFISQVVSVNFSDDTLVWVGKVEEDTTIGAIKDSLGLVYEYSSELSEDEIEEINGSIVTAGDWAIISLKPFTSDEELMITMKNGDVWTAQVTDASVKYIPGQPFVYEDAAIKVTAVGVGADIPDEAELVVTQITADMEVYDSYFKALNRGFGDNPYNGFNSLLYDVSIIVDGREYEPEKGRIEIKLEFKAHQLSSMLGQNLDEDVPLRVIHLPVVDETCESSIEDVDASQIEREYIETTIIGHDDTEAVSFSLDSLSVITVTGASTDVTITSSLMGTDMKSLGYNLYAVLVSATEDKTYSVKVDYTNGTFSGTIPNVPVGNYQLMLAYDINNGNVQIDMPKGTFIGHSNLVRIDKSGQYVFGYAAQMPEDKTISTSDNTVSFALQVSEVQSSVNVATIMDRAINYGLVANELHLPNNCYTNFATKKLDIQNQNTQTYYGHRSDGINVVPNIAADVTNHGQPLTTETNQAANYYVTDEDKGKVNSTNQEETIVRNKNEIEDRVEIMISNTLKQAEELAKQSSIVLPNGLLSVDVSPYAENATIVLDATALSGIQNGFTIVKRPGQTVIFNINGQNAAPPQNTKIKLVDDKGQQIGNIREAGDNMRDAPASDGNVWNKVIWNFPDATSVTANNNIGGVFLVPKGDFTATNKGGGWIVARGKVSVTNEWYGFPGSDEPFKQKIIRKTFIGIEGNHIDANYALKLWTHTNESTSGTTQDELISTLVLKPNSDASLVKDPSGINDQTGYMQTGVDAEGNTYYEWKTPSISVGNEHKLTEINSASTATTDPEHLDLIEFVAPFSGWNEAVRDYTWWQQEETFTSESEFEGIFNVSSHDEDYRQYVYVTNNYNVDRSSHRLTLTKNVVDPEKLEEEGQEYSFKITLKDEDGNWILDQTVKYQAQDGSEQTVESKDGVLVLKLKARETVTLLGLPYGTQYVITEEDVPQKCEVAFSGSTSDPTIASGKLIKDRDVTATNTYSDDPGVLITAHKDLVDGSLVDGQFAFNLVDGSGRVIQQATNDANGNIMFGTLIFSEDGEYDYRLYEVVDLNKKDIIYDTKMYTVHIVAEGGRARSVTYNGTDTTPMFRNQKVDFNSDKLTARKLFVDTDGKAIELVGGEFSFRATGSDGTVYTGTNSADGMVVFRDSNGNEVNLNALTNTTMFTITETDESYVGTVPTGQSLTYDDNTYYATATVATKAVTVEPVAINDNDKDTTYLTVTFVPKDSDGTTYYLKPLHDPAYSELRSDGTVTFTVPVSKNMENIIGDTWRQYTFKYGIGNYYSGGKEVGTVSFEAKGGNWGQDPVSIRNIKVDEQELSASTRSEKTVSLQYADDSYPVFVNTLQKDEPETVGFTFIKVWEDLNSNITDTWREDITVSLYSQKGKVADFELNSEGGSSGVYSWTGTKNGNGTYMFTIANLPAKDGEDILSYYVTEKQLKGYRIPVYGFIDNSGEVRTETTNMAVDGKVIINIPEASYELPSTGGQGTKLIYILGSILFMSAGMMLWRRRRYF